MSKKREKVLLEISKTKEKIVDLQAKLRELERQKTELENTEIVEIVRSTKMNTTELAIFLNAYREKSDASFIMSKQEENNHEEN
jgi:ribulose-5-phosphate 4-epimerase/fuculose-1-phosphate aldolase